VSAIVSTTSTIYVRVNWNTSATAASFRIGTGADANIIAGSTVFVGSQLNTLSGTARVVNVTRGLIQQVAIGVTGTTMGVNIGSQVIAIKRVRGIYTTTVISANGEAIRSTGAVDVSVIAPTEKIGTALGTSCTLLPTSVTVVDVAGSNEVYASTITTCLANNTRTTSTTILRSS